MEKAGGTELARTCQVSFLSTLLQLVLATLFVVASLYVASLTLELVRVTGITTVPPGILFVPYDQRQ